MQSQLTIGPIGLSAPNIGQSRSLDRGNGLWRKVTAFELVQQAQCVFCFQKTRWFEFAFPILSSTSGIAASVTGSLLSQSKAAGKDWQFQLGGLL